MEKRRLREEGVSAKVSVGPRRWRWRPDLRAPSDQFPPRCPTYRSEHTLRLPHGSAAPEEAHGHHQGPCSHQHIQPCGEETEEPLTTGQAGSLRLQARRPTPAEGGVMSPADKVTGNTC